MSGFLNNYFGFNKQQRNGLLVLLVVSLGLLVVRLAYPSFIKPGNIVLLNLPLIEKKLDSSYAVSQESRKNRYKTTSAGSLNLFVFDPNTVSPAQLLQLGLKEKTMEIFIKFRDKGFVFRQKKDLQKVYGISDKLYARLEPYILIEALQPAARLEKQAEAFVPANPPANRPAGKLELNSADSAGLVALDGIGAAYAKRILKYRAILGGFVSVEQLKEVYGFSETLFERVKNSFTVETQAVKKINLNKDDFKIVNKHPYLSYEITKTIFDWRRKTIINPVNLKDILNSPSLYQKLLPYLSFE